jgi:hypothetical protein
VVTVVTVVTVVMVARLPGPGVGSMPMVAMPQVHWASTPWAGAMVAMPQVHGVACIGSGRTAMSGSSRVAIPHVHWGSVAPAQPPPWST